jgi:pimeloyl-ACP methyl ester carboxylesterase
MFMDFIDNPDFRVEAGAAVEPPPSPSDGSTRPLLILSGYHSPATPGVTLARLLRRFGAATPDRTLVVSYPFATTVEAAASTATKALRSRGWAAEPLDVAGISMGGIVARHLAAAGDATVARLFTLASPHRGASITRHVRPDAGALQLSRGSRLLASLDASLSRSIGEVTCYALLRDWMVGATNTAPPGMTPLWLDVDRWYARPISHFSITSDRRIVADLALRLRGLAPWSRAGSPPPRD